MAKDKGKKSAKSRMNDAERLAALRWLAMKIDQVSIEVYVTHPDKFDELENAMRAAVRSLQKIGRPREPVGDEDCPGGYILCRDGLCAPMCDGMDSSAAARGKTRRR